jgi:hypothetical protein
MKNPLITALAATVLLGLSPLLEASAPPEGFTSLFNGTDLSGWHGNNPHDTAKAKDAAASLKAQAEEFPKHWSVENGELVNDGSGPYATTDVEYGDFELLVDFRLAPKCDSGIYLRGVPQVQIWDTTEAAGYWKHGADKGSGGLWNNGRADAPGRTPLVHADRPIGEWNSLRIRMIGSRTWVWLNGKLVVDGVPMKNYWTRGATPVPARGPIQLQTHGGEIRWKNIFIREIPPAEGNSILKETTTGSFTPLFNGKDLTGWQGAVDNYAVDGGAIISQGGGNLFTASTHGDFLLKFEFKLPPGGNNGLAIRYPGSGDAAYVGMCELQVLDDSAPQHAALDPRQYHGSAYGITAATRGYQRPVGEWNFQTVRVQGSSIKVELNGTPILDTDLSKVTEFMKPKFQRPIPADGHFGLAGHGPGVAFRNLFIQDLGNVNPG